VLMEVPSGGPLDDLFALGEHVETEGLRPLIAHPERGDAVQADPERARQLAERGWLLQINATSLLGRHGREAEELGWRFLEDGLATVVGSDGHRATRPPQLDEAYARAVARLGEGARRLFDGSALGLSSVASAPRAGEVALPGA
jgi:protein-tyrosine phosphatase